MRLKQWHACGKSFAGWHAYSEQTQQNLVYCSAFAEVINATKTSIEKLQGWIIKDVEIFKAGTFRGVEYTREDIADIVSNFYALKGSLDPVLKVDHSESVRDQIGWILDVRQSGEFLLADLHITDWQAFDKIQSGTWKKLSSEIYMPELAKTSFDVEGHVLRAVAIVSIPEVKDIKGIVLNAESWETDPQQSKREGEVFKMKYEEFLALLSEMGITLTDEQQTQLKEKGIAAFTEETAGSLSLDVAQVIKLSEHISVLNADKDNAIQKLNEILETNKTNDVKNWVDSLVREGKVLPAERDSIVTLAEKMDESTLPMFKETYNKRPKIVDLSQQGSHGTPPAEDNTTYEAFKEAFGQQTY